MNRELSSRRRQRWGMILLSLAVLLPSLYGFGTKFLEFIALYRGDAEGAFAITPVMNYLLASAGFLCLFAWAVFRGMFRDVEQPKYTMLESESRLDATAPWKDSIGLEYPARSSRRSSGGRVVIAHSRFKDRYDYDR